MLSRNHISDGRLNAELFLCNLLNYDRVGLYLNFDKPLSIKEIDDINNFISRRINNEPLQYITGTTSFYGNNIEVNKNVLIPRPETELLVEKISDDVLKNRKDKVSLFEIGTGSGAIIIALAKIFIKNKISYNIFTIDISQGAVDTAMRNLELNNLNNTGIRVILKDVFTIDKLKTDFDYIVSNPPYISKSEFELLESGVKDFEPTIALTDFEDGLNFYKRIFKIASDKGFTGKVFLETGFGMKEQIEILIKEFNFTGYNFTKDYNNIFRILELTK